MKMYSQIIAVEKGQTRLYINKDNAEHQSTCNALISEGYKPTSQLTKLSDKIFDCWYLYQEQN